MATVNLNPRNKSPNFLKKQGSNQWITLNVGGTCFLTTKTTLSRDPNSFLSRLIVEDSDLISDRVSYNETDMHLFHLFLDLYFLVFVKTKKKVRSLSHLTTLGMDLFSLLLYTQRRVCVWWEWVENIGGEG